MKVQCQCGAKYAIDVTPEMARNPVRFVCANCNTDLSGPINELVRQELGLASATEAAPAAPAKLSIAKSASTATHGAAVETAPTTGDSDFGQSCPKHQSEIVVEHCYVCRKPLCPKCMELFGFVCSPLCRAKAEATGIHVPIYAGQKSVREAREWRKIGGLGTLAAVLVAAVLGFWIWYAWFGSVPHPIFTAVFPERSYAGSSQITGDKQIVFLHGGLLARYRLGSKTAVWTNAIISRAQMDAEIDRQMASYVAVRNEAIRNGADSEDRPRVPSRDDLAKAVEENIESSLHLFVQGQNIWIARNGKLTRYDWDTGKAGQEISIPQGAREAKRDGAELQFNDENAFGQYVITHVDLASGETHTEEIGEPRNSAMLANERSQRPTAGNKGPGTVGLPTTAGGPDSDKPMDPNKVAQDAQNLPYAAKLALPATLSNTKHQQDILNEIKEDEGDNRPPPASTAQNQNRSKLDLLNRSFVDSQFGYYEWSSKVLEHRAVTHDAMKAAPTRSALENNPSVNNTAAVANEILNDMQRQRGGATITEDVSRYQVTVHRPDEKDVSDWTGEVIGPPAIYPQKTVTVVAGGSSIIVLDKSNKKLWDATLTYNIGKGTGLEITDPSETSLGAGPCVEHDGTLYVFDQATLTAFDLSNGNVRWRVPTIGIVGIFFDGLGSVYVNSTTADLENLRYAHQIDINKKIAASVLRVDCKTGKVLWNVQPGGFISHVEGKFVFCYASHQAPDLDPDALTTLPGMLDSAMDIRRLDPKNGKIVWDYGERRAPVFVRFNGNLIQLVFRKEVEVLKFLTL